MGPPSYIYSPYLAKTFYTAPECILTHTSFKQGYIGTTFCRQHDNIYKDFNIHIY